MNVLINMDMPKSCACCDVACRYYLDHGLDGLLAKICHTESRLPDCPLVPVPPHGRLIDADALLSLDRQIYDGEIAVGRREYIFCFEVEDAPTVIEAEEGE